MSAGYEWDYEWLKDRVAKLCLVARVVNLNAQNKISTLGLSVKSLYWRKAIYGEP